MATNFQSALVAAAQIVLQVGVLSLEEMGGEATSSSFSPPVAFTQASGGGGDGGRLAWA